MSVWIPVGAAVFLVALAVSAWVDPGLRLLHVLQGLIYVAVVLLARRKNLWGLGAGFTVAVAWNGLNLFATHFIQEGAVAFWTFLRTGEVHRLDTMMVTLGSIGHGILICACLAAALHEPKEKYTWWKFAGGGAAVIAYMALIIVLALPR